MKSELPDWDSWHDAQDREYARKQVRANRLRMASLKRRRKTVLHLSIVAGIALSMSLGAHHIANAGFVFLAGLVEFY